MARKSFLGLAIVIGFVLLASPVLPCEKALFGPKEFKVGRFHFHSSFQTFKAGKSGDAVLQISRANSHGRIHWGYVNLNGRFFSLSPILHTRNSTLQVPVHLRDRNYLWVFLYGQKGAAIKLKVKKSKQEPTNRVPTADDQSVELDEDTTASITLSGSDQDGDPLSFRIVSTPAHGTLSGDAPSLIYTPSADYNGLDTFTFLVNDGQADSQPATVSVTIRPVNDPPEAVSDSPSQALVGEEVSLDGSLSSDVDGDKLTYLWTLTSYPPGVAPAFSHTAGPLASFVPYLPGQYKAQLVVNDGTTDSPSDTVTISVAYPPLTLTEYELTASDRATGDRFGSSVSVDNNRAIIGAEGKGAAYIFESASPWAERAQISSGQADDRFGSAVAVSGDHALVGAQGDDQLGTDSGAAYMFRWDGVQWIQTEKLLADTGKSGDFFGAAVALSGDYAVVGAPSDDTGGDEWMSIFGENEYTPASTGLVWDNDLKKWKNQTGNYIFLRTDPSWANGLGPKAMRITTDPAMLFLLQVKKLGKDENWGEAWDYVSGTPVLPISAADIGEIDAYSLTAPIEITNIEFLVPATGGGESAGSAYVFKHENDAWTQQTFLTASDGAAGDAFGTSVALSGQTLIVGANADDDSGEDSGSAYVFVQDGAAWMEEAKLLAPDGQAGDQFGTAVAISGDIAVIGAPRADLEGEDEDKSKDCGAVYVFRYNGLNWTEESKLTAGDGKKDDLFGTSVSISGDYVAVGARGADGSGAMYVFKFDGSDWTLEGKVVLADRADGRAFGGSVSISGDVILCGAQGDANETGAAYAYTIDTYHTASINAEAGAGGDVLLSWSWVNALFVEVGPGIVSSAVPLDGFGSETVKPSVDTTYTITAYGPYGKDAASVTVLVEP